MDSNGLFNIARYRPTEASEKTESKKNSMLERARQRALKRKLEAEKNAETVSVADSVDSEKSESSESESEIEEDKKSEVSEVASDFQILEDVAALRRKKLRLDLPKWCQEPVIIEDVEPKLKTIKTLLPEQIYSNLKDQVKRLFPVQSCLIKQLVARGPRRDYAVQGRISVSDWK